MYAHEVATLGPTKTMAHYRQTQSPSGLIAAEEIGRTIALLRPNSLHGHTSQQGLQIASLFDIMRVNGSRNDDPYSSHVRERIDCDDLEAFVQSGIKRWEELVQGLGGVSLIVVEPAERTRTTESPSNKVSEDPFNGFVATPDEMEAMERIASSATPQGNHGQNTGAYI